MGTSSEVLHKGLHRNQGFVYCCLTAVGFIAILDGRADLFVNFNTGTLCRVHHSCCHL